MEAACGSGADMGSRAREPPPSCAVRKRCVILRQALSSSPSNGGGGDNYFQCTGVRKLAKGVGTKPARDRQTTNRLLISPG